MNNTPAGLRPIHIGTSVSPSFMPAQLDAIDRYMTYARRLGLTSIEIDFSIKGHYPQYAPLPYAWEESPVWEEVRRRVAQFPMAGAHLPFLGINPLSDDPEEAKWANFEYHSSIDRAGELGLRYVIIHSTGHRPGTTRENWLPIWVDYMGEMAEYARRAGLILCLENAAATFRLDDTVYVIRQVNSPWLRMTFDTGHAQYILNWNGERICAYEAYGSLENFIRREHDVLFTLHIHDNFGERDDHLVIGDGIGDFSYLRTLYELGFDGAWNFEHNIDDNWDSVEVAVRRLRALLGLPEVSTAAL